MDYGKIDLRITNLQEGSKLRAPSGDSVKCVSLPSETAVGHESFNMESTIVTRAEG